MTNEYLELKALGRECLGVWFCTVYVLTAGRGKKITWQKSALHEKKQKKAVNNRNSIKLPWFPVSYVLWTAWSDRRWLAEIWLAAGRPPPQHGALSIGSVVPHSFVPHLTVVFVLYSAQLKNVPTEIICAEPKPQVRLMQTDDLSYLVFVTEACRE